VIAEIQLQDTNIPITFYNNPTNRYDVQTGALQTNIHGTNITITEKILLQNYEIQVSNYWDGAIMFWNNNTYLGWYESNFDSWSSNHSVRIGVLSTNQIILIPNGATHFWIEYWIPNGTPTFTITDNSSLVTTTFYDSYPGGNVIGTTAGTQIGGGTTPYNLTFVTDRFWDPAGIESNPTGNHWRTDKVPIIDNSVILSAGKYSFAKPQFGHLSNINLCTFDEGLLSLQN
jgi:hypothetical protein